MKIKNTYSKSNSYTLADLLREFKKAGVTCSCKETFYKWEREGRITLDRFPATPKRAIGVRAIFEKQITEIVKAFLPGGKGYWHSDGHKGFRKPVKAQKKTIINDYLNK